MTIDWHFGPVDANTVTPAPLLAYRASGDYDWKVVEGTVDRQTLESRVIHRVELTGLQPNTKYEFQMLGHDKVYHFYTMPVDLSEPIRFAVGGDTRHSQAMLEKQTGCLFGTIPTLSFGAAIWLTPTIHGTATGTNGSRESSTLW